MTAPPSKPQAPAGKRPPRIFSPARRALRSLRSADRQKRDGAADFLHVSMAEDLIDRVGFMRVEPGRVLVIGDLTGGLTAWLNSAGFRVEAKAIGSFDEENLFAVETYDAILSVNALDTVNDVPGALLVLQAALKPGGLLLAAFPGAGSLPKLRSALLTADGERPAARIHPQIDARGGADLLARAGFRSQVADAYPLKVAYRSLDRLVQDLRDQAASNVMASAPPPLTRSQLHAAREAFLVGADGDGRIIETFEIVVLTGWKA